MGVLQSTATVAAQPIVEVPVECGDADQFNRAVEVRTGQEAATVLKGASVRILQHPEAYELDVSVGTTTRRLRDRDCSVLFRAAVVIVVALWESPRSAPSEQLTVLLSPGPSSNEATTTEKALTARPTTHSLPSAVRLTAASLAVVPRSERRTLWQSSVTADVGVASGTLPNPTPAVSLGVRVQRNSIGGFLDLQYLSTQSIRDPLNHGVRANAWGVRFGASVTAVPWLRLDAGAHLIYVRGSGLGSHIRWADGAIGAGPTLGVWAAAWSSPEWRLEVGATTSLWLQVPKFEITEYGRVFQGDGVSGGLALRADYRFY